MKTLKWTTKNIPNQTGKIAVVTGANSGIGFEAAKALAKKHAEVILAVRNIEKGEEAYLSIKAECENAKLQVMELDLSSLVLIRKFTNEFKSVYNKLDILINNAGVMVPPYGNTEDGFELQLGINHLGHFALTAQLFDFMQKSNSPRIVNVSSAAHKIGNLNFEDLNWTKRKYNDWKAYGDSKIANLYFTFELKRKLEKLDSKVVVTSCHPGWTKTNLQQNSGFSSFLNPFFAQKPEMGVLPTLRAAIDRDVQNGDFYGPNGFFEMKGYPVLVKPNELSRNVEIAEHLWKVSEELTNIKFDIN